MSEEPKISGALGKELSKRMVVRTDAQAEEVKVNRNGVSVVAVDIETAIVVQSVFYSTRLKVDYTAIPHAVYSHPQIASAGLREELETDLHPVDEPLELTLYDNPNQQWRACEDRPTMSTFNLIGEVPVDEIPDDAEIFCDEQGTALTFESFGTIRVIEGGDICGTRQGEGIVGRSSIDPTQPVPEAWPCEISE